MRLGFLLWVNLILLSCISEGVEVNEYDSGESDGELSNAPTTVKPQDIDHKTTGVQTSKRRKKTGVSLLTRKTRASSTPSQASSSRRTSSPVAKPAKQKSSMMDFFKQILLLWQLKERFMNKDRDEGPGPYQNQPPMMMNQNQAPMMMNQNQPPMMMNQYPQMNMNNNRPFYGGRPMNNFNPGMGYFPGPSGGFNRPMNPHGGFNRPMRPNGFNPRPQPRRENSFSPGELANMMNTFQAVTNPEAFQQTQPRSQQPAPVVAPISQQIQDQAEPEQVEESSPPPRRRNLRERRRTVDWVKEALFKFTSNDDRQRESDVINPIGRRSRGKSISSMLKMFPVYELNCPLMHNGILDFYTKWMK